jgi:hypothetical protein
MFNSASFRFNQNSSPRIRENQYENDLFRPKFLDYRVGRKISDPQQSWGYEDGPGRGRGHLCWEPLIFNYSEF